MSAPEMIRTTTTLPPKRASRRMHPTNRPYNNEPAKLQLLSRMTYVDVVKFNNEGVCSLERKNYAEALTMFRKALDRVITASTNTESCHHNNNTAFCKQNKNKKRKNNAFTATCKENNNSNSNGTRNSNIWSDIIPKHMVIDKEFHFLEITNMDYILDSRKKQKASHDIIHNTGPTATGTNDSNENSATLAAITTANTLKNQKILLTSYTTDVETEFEIFSQGLRIEKTSSSSMLHSIHPPSTFTELNKLLALILYNIGKVFQQANQLDEALGMHYKSLTSSGGFDTTTTLAVLHSIGQINFLQGNLEASTQAYTIALSIGKELSGDSLQEEQQQHSVVSSTVNCLNVLKCYSSFLSNPEGIAALQQSSDVDGAQQSSEGAASSNDSILIDSFKKVAMFYCNIGKLHFEQGEFNEAIISYKNALTIREKIYGENSLDVGVLLFNLGQAYHNQGELDTAISFFVKYFDIAKRNLAWNHLDIASVCCCLGKAFHEKEQFEYALIYYEAGLDIEKSVCGESSARVAMTLNKVGSIYYDRGLFDLALRVCKTGWSIEKKLNSKNENIIITLTNIAEIHRKKRQYASALEFYRKASALQKKTLGTQHPDVIKSMNRIGYVLYLKGDYSKCLKIYQDSLRLSFDQKRNHPFNAILQTFHQQAPSTIAAKTMYDIGTTLFVIGDLETALTCLNLSLHMNLLLLQQQQSATSERVVVEQFDILITLYDIARLLHHKGETETALETLYMLTTYCSNITNDYDDGTSALTKNKRDSITVFIRALSFMANIHLLNSNCERMMESYSEAVRLCRRHSIPQRSTIISLNTKIYRFDVDYPSAAASA